LSPDSGVLLSSTFLGGTNFDQVEALALGASGEVCALGTTESATFPTTPGAYDRTHNGGTDLFAAKLSGSLSSLQYSTFVGGTSHEDAEDIDVDGLGAAYIVGRTLSTNYPTTPGAYDTTSTATPNGPEFVYDALVTKLSHDGSSLDYSTFLGGTGQKDPRGIAVDASGAAYITGSAVSADYPTTPGCYDASFDGESEAYLTKLSAAGTSLEYSTFLGGTGVESGAAVSVDTTSAVFVAGFTTSADFPVVGGASQAPRDQESGFVTKFAPSGQSLVYSTTIGGAFNPYSAYVETPSDIAVDASGAVYVVGYTDLLNYPATPGAQDGSFNGDWETYVSKLSLDGTGLAYSTFIGGKNKDWGASIAVDASGAAHIAGTTRSADFPTTFGAYDTAPGGAADAFVAQLAPDGSSLGYSTLLGGTGDDGGVAIALGGGGDVYVGGDTNSTDYPVTPGAYRASLVGAGDVFVTRLSAGGGSLNYSTYVGGGAYDSAFGLAVDSSGAAYVSGSTSSPDFPLTPGAQDTSVDFYGDAFLTKLAPGGSTATYSTFVGGSDFDIAFAVALDARGAAYITGETLSWDFATTGFGSRDFKAAFVAKLNFPTADTPGVYTVSAGTWFVRNSNSPGAADLAFGFGPRNAGWTPLVGDWDGDGVDTPGLYAPTSSTFFLKNSPAPGPADLVFGFGPAGVGWVPLAGDWDGDGRDTVGLYSPATGTLFLRNHHAPGPADLTFRFGPAGAGWRPVAGDWDADGDRSGCTRRQRGPSSLGTRTGRGRPTSCSATGRQAPRR
jgi:hypothetical protein